MDDNKLKDKVLSDIIKGLEKDGTFTEVVQPLIKEMNTYLGADSIAVLHSDSGENRLIPVVEYTKGRKQFCLEGLSFSTFSLCTSGLKVTRSDGCSDNDRKIMDGIGAGTAVTAPIFVNGMKVMCFLLLDQSADYDVNEERMEFIHNVTSLIQDIAQKKVMSDSLLSSYEVFREILSSVGSGIVVCNRQNGEIVFENDIASGSEEVRATISECVEELLSADNMEMDLKGKVEKYNTEAGLWFEVKFSGLRWTDGSSVIVCTSEDITQKKKNRQKIEYQAHNDFLTGLYNRMKCESDLRSVIKKAVSEERKGAVLFIDLDDFKHINDGLGHQYGDILLQQIAAGLQGIPGLRGNCYRMGGDEFVVIVLPERFDRIDRIIKNIEAMFNKPWYLMETEYFCTMSMGIAVFPDNSKDVHEIIRMADVAMYEAKKDGKNGFTYYNNSDERNTIKRLDIENNMRQAIATGIDEFVIFYQPVVDIETNICTSCEALVRWDSKVMGFMGPGDFIPLAEYLGLITSIGDYVLEAACMQCKYWNEHGHPDFHINVNLSVVQLLQKDVVAIVKRIFDKTGVDTKNIVLEITESFAINDMDRVMRIIKGLKELGPKIALDDFGTGYSSLNYIKQLPLDIIKVDKAFIDDIVEDDYAQAFIKLIVDLSKTIGTKIVVEGVEHKEQLEILKSLGVDFIQGYYFGKPVPSTEFEKLNFNRRLGHEDVN